MSVHVLLHFGPSTRHVHIALGSLPMQTSPSLKTKLKHTTLLHKVGVQVFDVLLFKKNASDHVQHSTILGLCCTWLRGWPTGSLNSIGSFTAKSTGPHSCVPAFGLSASSQPGTHHFKIFSSFTACLYTGAVALPTSLCLGGPMRQTSSRRSPKPIVDKRLVLRARWATVQVTVSSASHLSVCLPFF